MRDRRQQLARIDRVRTVQLALARAAEADAQAHAASETALGQRIAQLAAATAPAAGASFGLAAAAYYRDRLQQSAHAAEARVVRAQDRAALASEAALVAERDRKAIEKLRGRAEADAALAVRRALEAAPVGRRVNRHDA